VGLVGGGEHPMFLVLVGLRAIAAVLGARRLSQIGVWSYVSQSAKWVSWTGRKVNQIKGICAQEVAQVVIGWGRKTIKTKVKMDSRFCGNDELGGRLVIVGPDRLDSRLRGNDGSIRLALRFGRQTLLASPRIVILAKAGIHSAFRLGKWTGGNCEKFRVQGLQINAATWVTDYA
jgi:hypothetical protein